MFLSRKLFNKQIDKRIKQTNELCFIDVGANKGQFSKVFTNLFRVERHILIEPIEECVTYLKDMYPSSVVIQTILSDVQKTSTFYQGEFTDVSSVLKIKSDEKCLQNINTAVQKEVQIDTTTLDEVVRNNKVKRIDFLKLDVQGAEEMVLEGGSESLKNTKFIYTEASLRSLYEHSSTIESLYNKLSNYDFKLVYVNDGFNTKNEGIVQLNLLFEKN